MNEGSISREEVWLRAWLVAAQREKADTSTGYADQCLKAFDRQFPIKREPRP